MSIIAIPTSLLDLLRRNAEHKGERIKRRRCFTYKGRLEFKVKLCINAKKMIRRYTTEGWVISMALFAY